MKIDPNDLRILMGGLNNEEEIKTRDDSPTWITNEAWDRFWDVAENSLNAYMQFTRKNNKKHSYILGLDILATGEADPQQPGRIVDLKPVILEGPCCNSYPACPNFFPRRLYNRAVHFGNNPDTVEYPLHPTKILDRIVQLFGDVWKAEGHQEKPVCGVFTLPYPGSEEETAHNWTLQKLREHGYEAYRITPDEKPEVKNGKLVVDGHAIDVCYRRIERKHIPVHYGEALAQQIINETPGTIWLNPFEVDDWRSKTIEEQVFRDYEKETGKKVSRPITLLGSEITPDNVRNLVKRGGFAHKKYDSTGGKGVFLHFYQDGVKPQYDYFYGGYDGRHMTALTDENLEDFLKNYQGFSEDAAIQQMRMIDSRDCGEYNLVYDTRINVIYDILNDQWEFLSGISRVVPCGPNVLNGNSLLTNVSSGAEMTALVVGQKKSENEKMVEGRMLKAMNEGKANYDVPQNKYASV